MRIGMIGAGGIAGKLALTIAEMKDVENYAIASRSLEKAQEFQQTFHFKKAYGSYEELLQDPQVDLVYIATPHSEHYAEMELCLKYHKSVLCEKAFTANAKQAADILSRFEKEHLFVTEAIWTRYLPSRKIIDDILSSGILGDIYLVSANLCYPNKAHPRLTDPSLAGGALLDMGIYPLTFALMVYHTNPLTLHAECKKTETGVDEATTMILSFPGGKQALLFTAMDGPSDRNGYVYGSKGYLEVTNCNNPERLTVYNANHEIIQSYPLPKQISGYEYEIEECRRCLKQNLCESPFVPHHVSVEVMQMMDEMRKQMGIVYPFEK
jgi:predicted dehydrogenase